MVVRVFIEWWLFAWMIEWFGANLWHSALLQAVQTLHKSYHWSERPRSWLSLCSLQGEWSVFSASFFILCYSFTVLLCYCLCVEFYMWFTVPVLSKYALNWLRLSKWPLNRGEITDKRELIDECMDDIWRLVIYLTNSCTRAVCFRAGRSDLRVHGRKQSTEGWKCHKVLWSPQITW